MHGILETAEVVPHNAGLTQAFVAHVYDVPLSEMRGATRGHPRAALARQVAMYMSHVVFGLGTSEIAQAFQRHKATTHHALRRVEDMRDNPDFDRSLRFLEATMRSAIGGAI